MSLVPQIGFPELILIGIIALIVVGPNDLPKLMRSAGQFVAKARSLAGEFTSAFDQMARETEMSELRQEIETLKNENVFAATKRDLDDSLSSVDDAVRQETSEIKTAIGADAKPTSVKNDISDAPSSGGPSTDKAGSQ